MIQTRLTSTLFLFLSTLSGAAFGWGSYGHQQVNLAAIELAKDSDIGKCFVKNTKLIQRYSVTPDVDWKIATLKPMEGDLHWFEIDAFVPPPITIEAIMKLPSKITYKDNLDSYVKLLQDNKAEILKLAPSKGGKLENIDQKTVGIFGSAPWRTVSLFQSAVEALKSVKTLKAGEDGADPKLVEALRLLGTMGHYVGDMSQPFHTGLNYDGETLVEGEPFTAMGVHSAFEEKILEIVAKANQDHTTELWDNFKVTMQPVLDYAKTYGKEPVAEKSIIVEMLAVGAPGVALVNPLIHEFNEARIDSLTDGKPENREKAITRIKGEITTKHKPDLKAIAVEYVKRSLKEPGEGKAISVIALAEKRIAASSALLARLWVEAYRQAAEKNANLDGFADCPELTFSATDTKKNYPKPKYLP